MPRRRGGRFPRSFEEPEQVLFSPQRPSSGEALRLEGGEAEHARRSLRLRTGSPVFLVDGRGGRYRGHVTALDKRGIDIRVEEEERLAHWPRGGVWLGAGVLRSTRMDYVIEKASELGVERLWPLDLERCVAHPTEDGAKLERWHRLAIESLKQSRRSHLMQVEAPLGLDAFLDTLPGEVALWVADPAGESPAMESWVDSGGPLVLVVGPEGGLCPHELDLVRARGGRSIRLGGNRLRSETAAVALIVVGLLARGEMHAGHDSA